MFIAALFTVAKTQKHPQYPFTGQWIKKVWYIYTLDYYSVIAKNEIMPFHQRGWKRTNLWGLRDGWGGRLGSADVC